MQKQVSRRRSNLPDCRHLISTVATLQSSKLTRFKLAKCWDASWTIQRTPVISYASIFLCWLCLNWIADAMALSFSFSFSFSSSSCCLSQINIHTHGEGLETSQQHRIIPVNLVNKLKSENKNKNITNVRKSWMPIRSASIKISSRLGELENNQNTKTKLTKQYQMKTINENKHQWPQQHKQNRTQQNNQSNRNRWGQFQSSSIKSDWIERKHQLSSEWQNTTDIKVDRIGNPLQSLDELQRLNRSWGYQKLFISHLQYILWVKWIQFTTYVQQSNSVFIIINRFHICNLLARADQIKPFCNRSTSIKLLKVLSSSSSSPPPPSFPHTDTHTDTRWHRELFNLLTFIFLLLFLFFLPPSFLSFFLSFNPRLFLSFTILPNLNQFQLVGPRSHDKRNFNSKE